MACAAIAGPRENRWWWLVLSSCGLPLRVVLVFEQVWLITDELRVRHVERVQQIPALARILRVSPDSPLVRDGDNRLRKLRWHAGLSLGELADDHRRR